MDSKVSAVLLFNNFLAVYGFRRSERFVPLLPHSFTLCLSRLKQMSNFTLESYTTESDPSEIKFRAFYKGEVCNIKAIKGQLAKRRIALALILDDLGECYKGLCFVESLEGSELTNLLYKSFLITYGKCFSAGKARGLSLDAKDIFKDFPDLYKLHKILIKTRNEYVAHGDTTICEQGELYLASTSSKHEYFVPLAKYSNPIEHSLKKEVDLCLFVVDQVKSKISKVEEKITKA